MIKKIIKRDGITVEDFTPSKLNKWGIWAAQKLGDRVDWSGVILDAVGSVLQTNGIAKSQDLQLALIAQCLARKDYPHNLMAGRLAAAMRRKELYDEFIPTVHALQLKLLKIGLMKKMDYTLDEYRVIESFIKHERDFDLTHFQIEYTGIKYGLKNLKSGEEYETTQFVYMRLAMHVAEHEKDKQKRLVIVQDLYEEYSCNRINPPTPAMNNLGTPDTGLASCCLYKTGDTIPSLHAGDSIAYLMTAASAGIGGIISSRSKTDPVRGGKILHKGKLPYFTAVGGDTKANTQGSRGGAICQYVPLTDPESETIIMMQNPRTPEDKRNRDVNICMMGNKFITAKALKREKLFLFNCYTAPDLYESFFSKDQEEFPRLYEKYEADPSFKKTYVDAYKLIVQAQTQSVEVGTLYAAFMDEINRHTPHLDPIYSSNLCVGGETPILTKEFGYRPIVSLVGKTINVWNGQEWSETIPQQTGTNQKLLTVILSNGSLIEATPYHKWYVQLQDENGGKSKIVEKKTHELLFDDKLIKYDLDICDHGTVNYDFAYENGFYTGDGTKVSDKVKRIYLYADKKSLLSNFNYDESNSNVRHNLNSDRIEIDYKNLLNEKFEIPSNFYTLKSRLTWLEGLYDADGCLTNNNGTRSLQLTSINYDFLVRLMLTFQELGIQSKICKHNEAGIRQMPNHKGVNSSYYCKATWRLLIANNGIVKLKSLGFNTKRLDLSDVREGNREATQFVKVVSVIDKGRIDNTYCFTENKLHRGMFAGVLTGQCTEITQPTKEYESALDLYATGDPGFIKVEVAYDVQPEITQIKVFEYSEPIKFLDEKHQFRGAGCFRKAGSMYEGGTFETNEGTFTVKKTISVKATPEVSLCSLAAIVEPNIHSDEQYEKSAYYALYTIDSCIDIATYPLPHIKYTSMQRRNAAVGLSGVAYSLAKKGIKYSSDEGLNEHHKIAERHSYFVIKAALKLGKERGNAPWMHKTLWPQGWLPIDTYKRTIDSIVTVGNCYDWETLREEIIENKGIRFSSLIGHMPLESSSKASGGPNSLYAIRDLVLSKTDGVSKIDWAATDSDLYADSYELAWNVHEERQIMVYGVYQKFADQAPSADLYKDRRGDKLLYSESRLMKEYATMVKYGMKTRYYQNNLTSSDPAVGTETEKADCGGGGCKM